MIILFRNVKGDTDGCIGSCNGQCVADTIEEMTAVWSSGELCVEGLGVLGLTR